MINYNAMNSENQCDNLSPTLDVQLTTSHYMCIGMYSEIINVQCYEQHKSKFKGSFSI